jgi:Pyruvate/2-oxoacid:ferredoxin oxidoreductase delta subunit
MKDKTGNAICSQCKTSVYYCPDPACKCAHHSSDTFPGYEKVECSMSDIPLEMIVLGDE